MDSVADEIAAMLKEYAGVVAGDLKEAAKETAKETVKELKMTSPEGHGSSKGHYKDGWGDKTIKENSNTIDIKIYNKKKPGLTHLLEKGHAKRGGGRVNGKPHIAPAEKKAIESFEEKVKERLSK